MAFNSVIESDVDRIVADLGPLLDRFSATTVLVTGANGFVCSYIVDVLARWNERAPSPCTVLAMDNMVTGKVDRLAHLVGRDDIRFVRHDVTKPFATDLAADWMVHGASIASPTVYRAYPLETLDANINGTRHLLELAKVSRAKGALLLSSSEIYGDPDPAFLPTPETYRGNVSCSGPRACYDESKRLAETLGYIYFNYFKVPVTVVRPFNVFGPGQPITDGRIIPDLMKSALNKEPITLLSDGKATRRFCYISDFIRAIMTLWVEEKSHGEAFNVGNDEIEISVKDLSERMCAVAAEVYGEACMTVVSARSEDRNYTTDNPQRRCPDLAKIRKTIGYQPQVGLDEGLKRTLLSYLEGRK